MEYNPFYCLQNGNDVRGAALNANGETRTLTPGLVTFICAAFVHFCEQKTNKSSVDLRIGVGHDSRITAQSIKAACLLGLSYSQVFDCGLITTPAMFQSTVLAESCFDAAMMITASHLPFNRNGIKFFIQGSAIDHDALRIILDNAAELAKQFGIPDDEDIISAKNWPAGKLLPKPFDMKRIYCEHMKTLIKTHVNAADYEHPLSGLHIAVDAGNGAAGFFAFDILASLGADISGSAFLEPDGMFPNHIPNPENKTAMHAACSMTVNAHADLGVIFDCDGDRGAVVFSDGTEVNRNSLIALLASIISQKSPHSTIVTDSVTSDELSDFLTQKLGMKHLRYRRGYKNVIDKGIELNHNGELCELAIETSGHGAFKDNYFSDDGAYIALKIICKLAELRKNNIKLESLIAELKQPAESREMRFIITDNDFQTYGNQVIEDLKLFIKEQPDMEIVTPNFEGIRGRVTGNVCGWFLLRMSLHDPAMPMNIETQSVGGIEHIMARLHPFFERYHNLQIKDV